MDKKEYIDENPGALQADLTKEDMLETDKGLSEMDIKGARLDEGLLSMSEKQ